VPKFGGGLYWPDSKNDNRDFKLGHDTSDEMKRIQFAEILDSLKSNGWFVANKTSKNAQDLVQDTLPLVKNARLMSLIEFGRCAHAEMAALLDAARRGDVVLR